MFNTPPPIEHKTHLGAYGLIVKDDMLLTIKKARGPYRGQLDLPGGKIEQGETLLEALNRELREEVGIQVDAAEYLEVVSFEVLYIEHEQQILLTHTAHFFRISDYKEVPLDFENGDESMGTCWLSLNSIQPGQVSPLVLNSLKHLNTD